MTSPAGALLRWYARNARDLPWRRTRDPYRVWVSEAMLQQTRVVTAIPYYGRFLRRFPTIRALARAPRQAVLKEWEGLGYYRRAALLHEGAKRVVARHGGRFPVDPEAIRALPGIGDYTAGAIRSIAFGQDAPLVDGNVARVLCRVLAIRRPPQEPAVRRRLWREAASLLPPGRAGDFNQALMELGATLCTPRAPDCPRCPWTSTCRARILGIAARLPARPPRRPTPLRRETLVVAERAGRVYLRRRPEGGLLGGLWEIPSRETLAGHGVRVRAPVPLGTFRHAFTHFTLVARTLRGISPDTGHPRADGRWVRADAPGGLPLSRLTRRVLDALRVGYSPDGAAPSARSRSSRAASCSASQGSRERTA